jgi:hypothetical protein
MASKSSPARRESEGQVQSRRTPFQQMVSEMYQRAELERDETTGISEEILDDILTADTLEDMQRASERKPLGGRDLAGLRQQVIDFTCKFGTSVDEDPEMSNRFEHDGKRMFLWVTAVRLDDPADSFDPVQPQVKFGETFLWNTSAPFVVAFLWSMQKKGMLPAYGTIDATELRGGRSVLRWKPLKDTPVTVQSTVVEVNETKATTEPPF